MNIQLTPGVTADVRIEDLNGKTVLYQNVFGSTQDLSNFIVKYKDSKPGWSVLEGIVMPLRMDSWQHFAEDSYVPTFFHYALKTHYVALKVLAIVLDIMTLPIRFVAIPFRALYNYMYPEEKHPIESDLGITGHDAVNLVYEKELISVKTPFQDGQGNTFQDATKCTTTGIKTIALKNLPGGVKGSSKEDQAIISYLNTNGSWGITKKVGGTSTEFFG